MNIIEKLLKQKLELEATNDKSKDG